MSNNDIRTAFFDFEIDVTFAPPRFPHCKHILEINDIDMGKVANINFAGQHTNIINEGILPRTFTMTIQSKIAITAGDIEIDLSGAAVEIDARLIQMRREDTWSIVLERLRDARDAAIDAAIDAARDYGLPERG